MAQNRLAQEKSPYLLQHADNPVDWRPWGQEALDEAQKENRPIFLSIGYATCHWCHVMAHESFEDKEVAEIINQNYIPVKVDREERPDLDQIYMSACQALTGQGGWPLSVFLTPQGQPFYAGTYFPKQSRYGRPGFIDLLKLLAEKWGTEEETVRKAAEQLTQAVRGGEVRAEAEDVRLDLDLIRSGQAELLRRFDARWGGFGGAPKFPTPHYMAFLMRSFVRNRNQEALAAVERTLGAMRQGGMFDHVGLGFHRYSVDEQWLVPHFEKMLYDQALLTLAYAEAFQLTGKPFFARVVREILTYVLRDMTSPKGAFFAAEDADSEGREGTFYVWRPQQVTDILGPENGALFCRYHDITEEGNFEDGWSIPHVSMDLDAFCLQEGLDPEAVGHKFEQARLALFEAREKRIHPLKDDKIITAWNGLMIAALAKSSQALGEPEYAQAAVRAAGFVLEELKTAEGRLIRRFRDGQAAHPGFLEDYAFLVWGLIELYETVFDIGLLEEADRLTRTMLDLFWDDQDGGLFFTPKDGESLIARQKEVYDGAVPSGNSVAALNLIRLGRMLGSTEFEEKADRLLKSFRDELSRFPMAHTHLLMAVDFSLGPSSEMLVVSGEDLETARSMIRDIQGRFLPHKVLLFKDQGQAADALARIAPYTFAMNTVDGASAFYLCQGQSCLKPVTGIPEMKELLG